MKYTIVVFNEGKPVGYWYHTVQRTIPTIEIRKKTIQLYDDLNELWEEFDHASRIIPGKWGDDHVPGVAIVSTDNSAEGLKNSLERHLLNAKKHWAALYPDRIKIMEEAISKIKL